MTRTLALAIAQGHDEVLPGYIKAGCLDIRPLIDAGIVRFSRFHLHDYDCGRCGGCDRSPHLYLVLKNGRTEYHFNCEEGEFAVLPEEISVYGIDLDRFFGVIAEAFGCEAPQPVAGMNGAWDFGISTVAFAKHPHRVVFLRRLDYDEAMAIKTNPQYTDETIFIAAFVSPIVRKAANLTAFSLPELLGYGVAGLVASLEPVKERFRVRTAKRAEENAAKGKPQQRVIDRMTAIADYLKNCAARIMALYREERKQDCTSDAEAAYRRTEAAMNAVTKDSIVEHFDRPGIKNRMKKSTIYAYLREENYPLLPEAVAVRFWLQVCTDRTLMRVTSAILVDKLKHLVSTVPDKGAMELWMLIEQNKDDYLKRLEKGDLEI